MAGIGFEIRRYLKKGSYLGILQAYGYAAVISSGPWILSIVGVVMIGALSISNGASANQVTAFLISVTYLIACSIILGAWLQLLITRFISDLIYTENYSDILPNIIGALLVTSISAIIIATVLWNYFNETTLTYKLCMLIIFIILSNIWILVVMLSGLKSYKLIFLTFIIGYGASIFFSTKLSSNNLEGLLAGFAIGQSIMFFMMLSLIIREYHSVKLIKFDFLNFKKSFYILAATSIFYNLGVWSDKIVFWINPITSEPVIGPIRSSFAYDPAVFIAYLAIIPGMAVLLLRIEADFVDRYNEFYKAIKNGDTLSEIKSKKNKMVKTIKNSLVEIIILQSLIAVTIILLAEHVLKLFGLSYERYGMLFSIYVVSVSIQILLMAINNVLYYLDQRMLTFLLAIIFAALNFSLTYYSHSLGPSFYGSGYLIAVLFTTFLAFYFANLKLRNLEYETFMLQ